MASHPGIKSKIPPALHRKCALNISLRLYVSPKVLDDLFGEIFSNTLGKNAGHGRSSSTGRTIENHHRILHRT